MENNVQKDYNAAFESLVKDKNDIVGHIAYCLYKHDKREHILRLKSNGKNTKAEITRVCEMLNSQGQIETYKKIANECLDQFINNILENNKDTIYAKYFKSYEVSKVSSLLNKIEKNISDNKIELEKLKSNTKPKTIWGELSIELLGNFSWTIILIIISIIAFYNRNDTIDNFFKNLQQPESRDSLLIKKTTN
jgi:hypothetical protein